MSKLAIGARSVAEAHEQPERLQAVERGRKRVLADRVVHDVDAVPVGQLPRALGEVFGLVVDDVRAARRLGELRLVGRADRADDRCAEMLGPLAGDQADAARRRVQQHGRVLADLVGLAQQVAHRHALQHHRRAGLVVDAVRQLDETVHRHQPLFRVAADRASVGATVADLELGHAGADRHHLAGTLVARNERHRHLVEARALIGIDVVDAHRMLLQPHLPRPRLADLHALPLHHLGAAVLMDADGVDHDRHSLLGWVWAGRNNSKSPPNPHKERGRHCGLDNPPHVRHVRLLWARRPNLKRKPCAPGDCKTQHSRPSAASACC